MPGCDLWRYCKVVMGRNRANNRGAMFFTEKNICKNRFTNSEGIRVRRFARPFQIIPSNGNTRRLPEWCVGGVGCIR